MALTQLESNTVSKGLQVAKKLLEEVYGTLKELNIIYDSVGGVKSTITQENLNLVSSFSGLTKTQLDDGMFALTATLKTDIENAFSQLAELSARA